MEIMEFIAEVLRRKGHIGDALMDVLPSACLGWSVLDDLSAFTNLA